MSDMQVYALADMLQIELRRKDGRLVGGREFTVPLPELNLVLRLPVTVAWSREDRENGVAAVLAHVRGDLCVLAASNVRKHQDSFFVIDASRLPAGKDFRGTPSEHVFIEEHVLPPRVNFLLVKELEDAVVVGYTRQGQAKTWEKFWPRAAA